MNSLCVKVLRYNSRHVKYVTHYKGGEGRVIQKLVLPWLNLNAKYHQICATLWMREPPTNCNTLHIVCAFCKFRIVLGLKHEEALVKAKLSRKNRKWTFCRLACADMVVVHRYGLKHFQKQLSIAYVEQWESTSVYTGVSLKTSSFISHADSPKYVYGKTRHRRLTAHKSFYRVQSMKDFPLFVRWLREDVLTKPQFLVKK